MGKERKEKIKYSRAKTYDVKYKIYRVIQNSFTKGQRSLTVCVTRHSLMEVMNQCKAHKHNLRTLPLNKTPNIDITHN
jgi:hypothetical protein